VCNEVIEDCLEHLSVDRSDNILSGNKTKGFKNLGWMHVTCETLTVVDIRIIVLWNVTSFRLVNISSLLSLDAGSIGNRPLFWLRWAGGRVDRLEVDRLNMPQMK
jgi:hypothetical protein